MKNYELLEIVTKLKGCFFAGDTHSFDALAAEYRQANGDWPPRYSSRLADLNAIVEHYKAMTDPPQTEINQQSTQDKETIDNLKRRAMDAEDQLSEARQTIRKLHRRIEYLFMRWKPIARKRRNNDRRKTKAISNHESHDAGHH
jgi:hypothetical protein